MKTVFTRIFQYGILVLLMQSFIIVSGFSQSPATLMGIVTNCNTGNPIIGALVSVGTQSTYSVFGGIYSLSVNPPGTFTVTCQKIGYDLYTHNGVVLSPGSTVNLPICLNEAANPPSLPVASIDSTVSPPRVSVSWQVPKGDYELLYDDGIMDDFTVWALPGNMNAVKFTPLDYPVTVTGGKNQYWHFIKLPFREFSICSLPDFRL